MAYYNATAQEQPEVQFPAPIVYYTAPPIIHQPVKTRKEFGPHYDKQTSVGLGASLIVLGCISIAAGIMTFLNEAGYYFIGVGVWVGAFFLTTGSIAIAAGKHPKNSLITATLVFSVFGYFFAACEITIASLGLMMDINCQNNDCTDWSANIPVSYAPQQQPETVFIQGPSAFQPQQPPQYYVQQQHYPSTSNQQQMMYVGVQQTQLTTVKF